MRALSWTPLVAVLLVVRSASADGTSDCIASSESGQSLRDSHSLLEARDKFAECSRDLCPRAIRLDCIRQRTEVAAAIPSVVFRAKDSKGDELTEVTVTCDGSVIASRLDGKAVSVDPGAHTFRFEGAGFTPFDRKIVVGEGEKNRLVVVETVSETASTRTSANNANDDTASTTSSQSASPEVVNPAPFPMASVIVGGIGVAAAVPMAIFWLAGTNDVRDMKDTCAPSAGGAGCPASRVDSDRTKLVVGDVFMGVSLAGIITGAVLYFTRSIDHSNHEAGASTALLRWDATPVPGGAMATAAARF